jgi:hypothetical protein
VQGQTEGDPDVRLMFLAQLLVVAMTLIVTESFHASATLAASNGHTKTVWNWLVDEAPTRARIAAVR